MGALEGGLFVRMERPSSSSDSLASSISSSISSCLCCSLPACSWILRLCCKRLAILLSAAVLCFANPVLIMCLTTRSTVFIFMTALCNGMPTLIANGIDAQSDNFPYKVAISYSA